MGIRESFGRTSEGGYGIVCSLVFIMQEQQEQNPKHPMFEDHPKDPKYFWPALVVLVLVIVVASGYFGYRQYRLEKRSTGTSSNNPITTENTAAVNENLSGDLPNTSGVYRDEELGFEFSYPQREIGQLSREEEWCFSNLEDPASGEAIRELDGQPCVHVVLQAAPAQIVVSTRTENFQTLGRGAYWGDLIEEWKKYPTPERFLEDYCQSHQTSFCEVKVNDNGVKYVLSRERYDAWGREKDVLFAHVVHSGHSFPVIKLSNERLIDQLGQGASEEVIRQILASFKFIKS